MIMRFGKVSSPVVRSEIVNPWVKFLNFRPKKALHIRSLSPECPWAGTPSPFPNLPPGNTGASQIQQRNLGIA